MESNARRPARGQALPAEEAARLAALSPFDRHSRAAALFESGWTLRAIGEAFSPPKPRSTVKSWIDRSSDARVVELSGVPDPKPRTTPPAGPPKPVSPGLSSAEKAEIFALAVVARKYRASMSPLHAASTANVQLSRICHDHKDRGVTTRELADAAGVTYRAMAKRLDK